MEQQSVNPAPIGVRIMARFSNGTFVGYRTPEGAFFRTGTEGSPGALPEGEILEWSLFDS